MEEVSVEDIRAYAKRYHEAGDKWHFHILTPRCGLNPTSKYAIVLECPSKSQVYVHHSSVAEKETGKELVSLLHGNQVTQHKVDKNYKPSPEVGRMIERAKELNSQGIEWHHHMLFPDCQFNSHAPKFNLMFEDPRGEDLIESLSDDEPVDDLNQIVSLFFDQK